MAGYVPKIRVAVRLSVIGYPPMEGMFSLDPGSRQHDGPETILDRLNSEERLLPFHRAEDDVVMLVSRTEVEYVAAGDEVTVDYVMPPPHHVTHQERVRVRFRAGQEVCGILRLELPEDLNRVSDYLNLPEDFFPLATPGEVLLVNKRQITTVRLFDASPLPASGEESQAGLAG